MDIVVTSGTQDPCNFVSNFADAINIMEGYEIAVKSIFHAPAYNITGENNEFTISVKHGNDSKPVLHHYTIPEGFYETTCDVAVAIYSKLSKQVETEEHLGTVVTPTSDPEWEAAGLNRPPSWLPKFKTNGETISLIMSSTRKQLQQHFVIGSGRDSLFRVLGYCAFEQTLLDRLDIVQRVFENCLIAGFMYSNIVTNLTIDQQQSRLLTCFPVGSKPGYNYYEFQNPTFRPLSVHGFTDLTFVLTDVDGKLLRIDTKSIYFTPTVIHLNIRKK